MAARTCWLPGRIENWPERKIVVALTLGAAAIRFYLTFTSFCISGDGPAYISMAQHFASGEAGKALAAVFSPLYPFLISLLHPIVPDWELAGDLISAVLGTATVPLLYFLMVEVFERRDVAIGAAALAAIHPLIAEYSASVRTEAGFISLMLAAVYLFMKGIRSQRLATIAFAGAVGGVAYLYRTEAIGLLIVCVAFLFLGAVVWKTWALKSAACLAFCFAAVMLTVASPYMIYLRSSTGHWTVGRELSAAMGFGVAQMVENKSGWQASGLRGDVSILAPLLTEPRAYLRKVVYDFAMSCYALPMALGFVLFGFLMIGLRIRGRAILDNWRESLLALLFAFYFVGFSFSYTGTRFVLHLIPYTFGWVMLGLEASSRWLARVRMPGGRFMLRGTLALIVALTLLPGTLWPIGYDIRGLRYAGEDIARRGQPTPGIVTRDRRVAFYARGKFIELPLAPKPDLCGWIASIREARYLMVSRREERGLGDLRGQRCLSLIKRYPRDRDSYYDLFQINRE